jgi:hypothetical protein
MYSPSERHQQIPVDITQLRKDVEFFTSQPRPRHYGNPEILKVCAEYIEHQFAQFTDRISTQPFTVRDRDY